MYTRTMTSNHNLAIELEGVTKSYGERRALDGLTLSVPKGIVFGFLGPNGAGKTTTINVLLGLLRPDRGSVRVLELDPSHQADAIRSRVGVLLDETGLYQQLTVHENLEFYARVGGLDAGTRAAVVAQALQQLGLWERRNDRAGTLSRGMQQRLALARARLHDPELLLLDEPTTGLDVMSAREVRRELAEIAGRGTTIFLTTHNMEEAEQLCARVAVIRQGKLVAEGEPSALLAASGHEVLITGPGIATIVDQIRRREDVLSAVAEEDHLRVRLKSADPAGVVAEVVAAGVQVREVVRGKRLEDAFVELVEESR